MSEYTATFSKRGAYWFNQQTVVDLFAVAKQFVEGSPPTIRVSLKHGHEVEMSDAEAILTDAFVRNSVIECIQISSWHPNRISIRLGGEALSLSIIDVTIAGPREKCTAARAEIETILSSARLWYAPLFEWWFFKWVLPWIVAGSLLSFGIDRAFVALGMPDAPVWVRGVWLFLVAFLLIPVLNFSGRWMFPHMVFGIGRSNKIGERAKYWRNAIGIGLILAVLAGLVSMVIYDWWK